MTLYGVHAGTEGASIAEVLAFWRRVESLGYEWISSSSPSIHAWMRFALTLSGISKSSSGPG